MASPRLPERFRLGSFELQPDERRLLNGGVAILLRPRAFDLLTTLVDRAGHLVTKNDGSSGHGASAVRADDEPLH